jgi:pimeloyl-ACP methyl ester carboxylesterase
LGYGELANRLPDRAFHAFNFIEAEMIVEVDPDGPYVLFGYSGGGNLAFRTAAELERRGKCVSDIVMLDSSRFLEPFGFPADEARRLALQFIGADSVQPYLRNPALKDKVIRKIERYYDELSRAPDDAVVDAHLVICENSSDAFHQNGRVVCSKVRMGCVDARHFQTVSGVRRARVHAARVRLELNADLLRGIFAGVQKGFHLPSSGDALRRVHIGECNGER